MNGFNLSKSATTVLTKNTATTNSSFNDLEVVEEMLPTTAAAYTRDPSAIFFQQKPQQQQPMYTTPYAYSNPTPFQNHPQQQQQQQQQVPAPFHMHHMQHAHSRGAPTPAHFLHNQATPQHFAGGPTTTHGTATPFGFNQAPFIQSQTPVSATTPLLTAAHFNYKSDMHLNENTSVQFSKPKLINRSMNAQVLPSATPTPNPFSSSQLSSGLKTPVRAVLSSESIAEKQQQRAGAPSRMMERIMRDQSGNTVNTSNNSGGSISTSASSKKIKDNSYGKENNENTTPAATGNKVTFNLNNGKRNTPHQVTFNFDNNEKNSYSPPTHQQSSSSSVLQDIGNSSRRYSSSIVPESPTEHSHTNNNNMQSYGTKRHTPTVYSRYYQSNSESPFQPHPLQTMYKGLFSLKFMAISVI